MFYMCNKKFDIYKDAFSKNIFVDAAVCMGALCCWNVMIG